MRGVRPKKNPTNSTERNQVFMVGVSSIVHKLLFIKKHLETIKYNHLTKDVGKDVITNHHTNRKEEPVTE